MNVKLIPIVKRETIKQNGDIVKNKITEKDIVATDQNVNSMKIVMTKTHVLVTYVLLSMDSVNTHLVALITLNVPTISVFQ